MVYRYGYSESRGKKKGSGRPTPRSYASRYDLSVVEFRPGIRRWAQKIRRSRLDRTTITPSFQRRRVA